MVEPPHYVPVLPVKRGELMALRAVDPAVKARLTPLFVVTTPDESAGDAYGTPTEQILDGRVAEIANRWGSTPAFADVRTFGDEPVPPGVHPLVRLLSCASERRLALIPVTGLTASGPHRQAVREVVASEGRGVCLRVPVSEWPLLRADGGVYEVLDDLGVAPGDVDLVLDLATAARAGRAFPAVARTIASLPRLGSWRSLVVAGTAYPSPRDHLDDGLNEVRRSEWVGYERLWNSGAVTRLPVFGDYGITHPDAFHVSPYILEVRATLRYTTPDSWLIVRGDLYSARTGAGIGAAAIPPIAQRLRSHPQFGFSQHCRMESWVSEVAYVGSGTGNPTTWHQHATHHHLVVVSEQLKRLSDGQLSGGAGSLAAKEDGHSHDLDS